VSSAALSTDAVLSAFASEVGDSARVSVEGGRTRWERGGTLEPDVRTLRAPHGIVAHRPEEMTVTVRAGTTVAELDAALARTGQRCALPDRGGTVGGAIVVGEHHLEVLGRGTVRACVLEVRYVSAEGRLIRGGGPTVKNVSGFDLPRLLTGSLGTLGLLAEVVVRTNPLPAAKVWLRLDGADPRSVRSASRTAAAVLWDGDQVHVGLEGHPDDLRDQIAALGRQAVVAEVEGPPPLPPHRWSLPPADVYLLDRTHTGAFVASIGVGTVFATPPQPPRRPDPGAATVGVRLKSLFDPTGRLNPGRNPTTPG